MYNNIQKQKLAFAGHILRGSSGDSILHILEGKLEAQLAHGHPDECGWMISRTGPTWKRMKQSRELQRTDVIGEPAPQHVNLLN